MKNTYEKAAATVRRDMGINPGDHRGCGLLLAREIFQHIYEGDDVGVTILS